jgi:uncharacterized protein (TIRG00374 family)
VTTNDIEQHKALAESIKFQKIIIPVLIGIGVVVFLIWKTFDLEAFKSLSWNGKTALFFGLGLLLYVLRHIVLSFRLQEISDGEFSFFKSIELIFIWEFASTISPTSFGGSAVAIFLLAQEKVGGAKSIAMVLYAVLLDTIFFLVSIPILYGILGKAVLRPIGDPKMDIYTGSLLVIFIFTLVYGTFMLLGILKPRFIGGFILWLSKRKWLQRFKSNMRDTAKDLAVASRELRTQSIGFHIRMTLYTFAAWILRFLVVVSVISGVIQGLNLSLYDIFILFGRSEMMHVITQFSPTPGGAGVAEGMFGGFFTDYISNSVGTVIALIWRLITYYPYLLLGLLVIPNWLRKVMRSKRSRTIATEK